MPEWFDGGRNSTWRQAQIDLRGALCVPDARLLLGSLGPCALPRHMDAQLALNGALPDGVEEMAFVAGGAVMLCAYQQINAAASSLLVEQLVEVGLPVHHADLARGGQLGCQCAALAKSLDPGEGLLVFDRYRRRAAELIIRSGRGRRTLRAQEPQRQRGQHQRRMQVQPATLRARLVAPNDAQPSALDPSRIVHIGAILNAKHRRLGLHPLHRALSVRRQDGRHADLRVIGPFDQAAVRLDGRFVTLSGTAERAPRHRTQRAGKIAQPRVQTPVAQVRAAKFMGRLSISAHSSPSRPSAISSAANPAGATTPSRVRKSDSSSYT